MFNNKTKCAVTKAEGVISSRSERLRELKIINMDKHAAAAKRRAVIEEERKNKLIAKLKSKKPVARTQTNVRMVFGSSTERFSNKSPQLLKTTPTKSTNLRCYDALRNGHSPAKNEPNKIGSKKIFIRYKIEDIIKKTVKVNYTSNGVINGDNMGVNQINTERVGNGRRVNKIEFNKENRVKDKVMVTRDYNEPCSLEVNFMENSPNELISKQEFVKEISMETCPVLNGEIANGSKGSYLGDTLVLTNDLSERESFMEISLEDSQALLGDSSVLSNELKEESIKENSVENSPGIYEGNIDEAEENYKIDGPLVNMAEYNNTELIDNENTNGGSTDGSFFIEKGTQSEPTKELFIEDKVGKNTIATLSADNKESTTSTEETHDESIYEGNKLEPIKETSMGDTQTSNESKYSIGDNPMFNNESTTSSRSKPEPIEETKMNNSMLSEEVELPKVTPDDPSKGGSVLVEDSIVGNSDITTDTKMNNSMLSEEVELPEVTPDDPSKGGSVLVEDSIVGNSDITTDISVNTINSQHSPRHVTNDKQDHQDKVTIKRFNETENNHETAKDVNNYWGKTCSLTWESQTLESERHERQKVR